MANIPQLKQQQGNKICRKLLDELNLRNVNIVIGYSNKNNRCININFQDYSFYNFSLGFVPSIYVPFVYNKIPVILNY